VRCSDDALPGKGGLYILPTDLVACYADPFIQPNHPSQRRQMEYLTRSIAQHGIIDPLTIKVEDGRAHVFDGNHRLAVAQRLGIPSVPVLVTYDDRRRE
jgi:ParB-like chromosome segregation protein Spo0J